MTAWGNFGTAVWAVVRRSAYHAVNLAWVYFRRRIFFKPAAFRLADFINRSALWAGDKVTFPKPEKR